MGALICQERAEPLRELWYAVLSLALEDATSPRAGATRRREALEWMFSEDTGVGTFLWTAQCLAVEADGLRAAALDGAVPPTGTCSRIEDGARSRTRPGERPFRANERLTHATNRTEVNG